MNRSIMVSIICNTYNHAEYIKDALESFMMQKTNFPFEVLVHDDASTDGTADIIREYEKKYPNIIKPIYQSENQYSRSVRIGPTFQYPRVKGKYVAFCEGDDYWIDENKLQKQFDAMEKHPECDICAHAALEIDATTNKKIGYISHGRRNRIFNAGQVIVGGGQFVATNSLFCRSKLNENIPKFRNEWNVDYTFQIHGSLRGGMLYLKDCMSVYRFMVKGSWNDRSKKDINLYLKNLENQNNMYDNLNIHTNFVYDSYIKQKRAIDKIYPLFSKYKFDEIFSNDNIELYKKLPIRMKYKICISKISPKLLNILLKIKRTFFK